MPQPLGVPAASRGSASCTTSTRFANISAGPNPHPRAIRFSAGTGDCQAGTLGRYTRQSRLLEGRVHGRIDVHQRVIKPDSTGIARSGTAPANDLSGTERQ